MTYIQFKPETTALVLIDYQVGTLQLIKTLSSDQSLRNAVMLAKAAKALGLPVVLTTSQEDKIQGPLPPAFEKLLPDAYESRIQRAGIVNAWADPKFAAAVKATGKMQLVMGGVTTDICLVFPSISAVEAGYEVQAVMDASGSAYEIQDAHTDNQAIPRSASRESGELLSFAHFLLAKLCHVSEGR